MDELLLNLYMTLGRTNELKAMLQARPTLLQREDVARAVLEVFTMAFEPGWSEPSGWPIPKSASRA